MLATFFLFDLKDCLWPFLFMLILYLFFLCLWLTQWLKSCSNLSLTPLLHLLVTCLLLLKIILLLVCCAFYITVNNQKFQDFSLVLLCTVFNMVEALYFVIVFLACKGWKITRNCLNRREKILCCLLFLSIVFGSIFSLYIQEFYVIWISFVYVALQRITFTSIDDNIHYLFSFLTPHDNLRYPQVMHPDTLPIILAKRSMFFRLRLQTSAWVILLALREMLVLSLGNSSFTGSKWLYLFLYELTCIWMLFTIGYNLRYRTPFTLHRHVEITVRKWSPLILPRKSNISSAYFIVDKMLATRQDHDDIIAERRLISLLWK